ncbi:hypothetical protein GCM10027575_64980 [Phytohabitans suffuscus]
MTVVAVTAAAAPAHAELGPPIPVDIQLTSSAGGYQVQVGRLVGTIQFDYGASAYYLSLVVCRQSAYAAPDARWTVNEDFTRVISQDGVSRPEICGGHGLSGAVERGFSYPGLVQKIRVSIEGIHFDGSTARRVSGGREFLNPYY